MSEILSIHIGQAGIQQGNYCWELFCYEHGINPDGSSSKTDEDNLNSNIKFTNDKLKNFFSITEAGRYVPRSVFIDSEPSAIDEIKSGTLKQLYHPGYFIHGKEDMSKNFAIGCNSMNFDQIDISIEKIRKLTENCENFHGFIIYNSIGGGTGSGFGANILEKLSEYYNNVTKFGINIFPSSKFSESLIEPYNSIFSLKSIIENINCSVVIDNEALHDICKYRLNIENPNFKNLNRITAHLISNFTCSMRFSNEYNDSFSSLSDLEKCLIPHPALKFVLCSHAPFIPYNKSFHEESQPSLADISMQAFEPNSMIAKCNPIQGKYVSCILLYRGDVQSKYIGPILSCLKTKSYCNFVEWSPLGFKCGINYNLPTVVPGGELAKSTTSLSMIGINSAIKEVFSKITKNFDSMYSKKAFVHWFLNQGISEGNFEDARENLAVLEMDFKEVELNEPNQEEEEI